MEESAAEEDMREQVGMEKNTYEGGTVEEDGESKNTENVLGDPEGNKEHMEEENDDDDDEETEGDDIDHVETEGDDDNDEETEEDDDNDEETEEDDDESDTYGELNRSSFAAIVQPFQDPHLYVWKTKCEHVTTALCYNFDISTLLGEIMRSAEHGSLDIIYILYTFLVCMPLLYMQTFIGQFSQTSCLVFGRLLPILCGLGISMLLVSFSTVVQNNTQFGLSLKYMLYANQEPWFYCRKKENCISRDELNECKNKVCNDIKKENVSTYIYLKFNVQSGGIDYLADLMFYVVPWAIISVTVLKGIRYYVHVIRKTFITTLSVMGALFLCMIFMSPEVRNNFRAAFDLSVERLFRVTPKGVLKTLPRALTAFSLANAGHILYGCYLPPKMKLSLQTVAIIATQLIIMYIFKLFSRLCTILLTDSTKIPNDNIKSESNMETIYYIIPAAWGTLSHCEFFIFCFYTSCCLLTFNVQVTQVDAICESLICYFPSLRERRLMIVVSVCVAGVICTIPSTLPVSAASVPFFVRFLRDYGTLLVLLIETTFIMYIYFYQQLWDDVHFVDGLQPTCFWKGTSVCAPFVLLICTIYFDDNVRKEFGERFIAFIYMLPIIAGAIYKCVVYIAKNDFLGLFIPEEKWGPIDPNERKLRRICNPRTEIRRRRRVEECQHFCLVNSEAINRQVIYEYSCHAMLKSSKSKDHSKQLRRMPSSPNRDPVINDT